MLIEQHASWLALNNVVGCPNNCVYCFLQQKGCHPEIICSSQEAVKKLLNSELYRNDIPICIMPNTDAFATPSNKKQLFLVCQALKKQRVPNLIIVITKRKITQQDCAYITAFRKKGLNLCIYVSYSGLEAEFEKGIRHKNSLEAIETMKSLKQHQIPCVHYWRPLLPQNTDIKTLQTVLNIVKKYCIGSCMTGLKLYPYMNCRTYWPDAQKLFDNGINPECFVPKGSFDNIIKLAEKAKYRVFVDNVCILSDIQKIPCKYGIYNSHRCQKYNLCSKEQRQRCGQFYDFQQPRQIKADKNHSLSDILEIAKQQKVSIMNQKINKSSYWQSSFTNDEWLEL